MNAPLNITGKVGVWLSPYGSPQHFEDLVRQGDQDKIVRALNFSPSDMTSSGWTRLGDADVSLVLAPTEKRMAAAVQMLQQRLARERAESQQRQNQLLDEISKLQALTYESPEVEA